MVGWADPAHHAVGVSYAQTVKGRLGPLSSKLEPYVNFSDTSASETLNADEAASKVGGRANLARLQASSPP